MTKKMHYTVAWRRLEAITNKPLWYQQDFETYEVASREYWILKEAFKQVNFSVVFNGESFIIDPLPLCLFIGSPLLSESV